jgi:subtilisin-like proprotein convertase family protein
VRASGTWRLTVIDFIPGTSGKVGSWALTLTP